MTERDPIRAAGGLILVTGDDGATRLAVVHRPKYDDWSLPKGKLDDGESEESAALREVEEETGLTCRITGDGGAVFYVNSSGRPKRVTYFFMQPIEGAFEPNDEVDELRWLTVAEAVAALSYEHDKRLVAGIDDMPRL